MKADLIIKNGDIITPENHFCGDIAICDGKISAVAEEISESDEAEVIDASRKYVFPGAVDSHVHFQLDAGGIVTCEDFECGSRAAAYGGVTTVIDFANQDLEKGLLHGIRQRMKEADGNVCIDYGLHSVIIRWDENIREEMKSVIEFGVPTFKMFMIYEKRGMKSDDADFFSALETTKENGARILVHAESENVLNLLINRYLPRKKELGVLAHALSRPNFIEAEAVSRAITWAEAAGGKLYIVHTSTGEAADIIAAARNRGVDVEAETCPQYLVLNEKVFRDKERGHLYATCPQLKAPKDNARLWKALMHGEISSLATDTCTFNIEQKNRWNGDFTKIPYGMPGVETMVPILFTFGVMEGRMDLSRFVSLVSANPSRIMGMYPEKGSLAPGTDADIMIIDPEKRKTVSADTLATNCDWSPYEGMKMRGFPDYTICRGKVIIRNGEFTGDKHHGNFVVRSGFMGSL